MFERLAYTLETKLDDDDDDVRFPQCFIHASSSAAKTHEVGYRLARVDVIAPAKSSSRLLETNCSERSCRLDEIRGSP